MAEQVGEPEEQIVFLGAISAEGRLVPGEWMGYLIEDTSGPQKYPCVLVTDCHGARFDFCGWKLWRAHKPSPPYQTNVFEKILKVGGVFHDHRRGSRGTDLPCCVDESRELTAALWAMSPRIRTIQGGRPKA